MRIVPTTLGVIGAAGVLVLAAPAFAANTYTVTAGSAVKGNVAYTATSGSISFRTSGGQNLSCSSSDASGTVKLGSGQSGKNVAKISKSAFKGCVGPAGIPLNVAQKGTWALNATGVPSAAGVTDGNISKISAHVSNPDGQCAFDVNGTVDGSFDSPAQKLNVTPPRTGSKSTLAISNVAGCFGLVSNGQTATFTTTYTLSNKVGPIKITSP